MLSTDLLNTELFERVTGQKNRLSSPFARNFDSSQWRDAMTGGLGNERDANLCLSAIFFGAQVSTLRQRFHDELFRGISKRSALILAVGSANRNFFALRDEFRKRRPLKTGVAESIHLMELGKAGVENAPQSGLSSDDISTAIVDTLPHWFFEAKGLTDRREPINTDFFDLERRAGIALSVEAGIRDLWNAALWEGSRVKKEGEEMHFGPADRNAAYFWFACQMRSEAATFGPLALYHDLPEERDDLQKIKSVTVSRHKGRRKLTYGKPLKRDLRRLIDTMNLLEKTYLSDLLDEEIDVDGSSISPRVLIQALWCLERLGTGLNSTNRAKHIKSYRDASELSLRISKLDCIRVLKECLKLNEAVAKATCTQLTLNPNDTKKCFNEGVWLHPLIELDDDNLMIVMPSAAVGAKVRFVERTLSEALGPDLKKSRSPGERFESGTRLKIDAALKENEIISDFASLPHALKKKADDGEEIDLLFRIGKTIIVGELKCLLAPTESMERYNHLSKLEEAATQAKRKAAWLEENLNEIEGTLAPRSGITDLTVLPLVVLNQRIGSGLVLDGVTITDIFLLELYTQGGSYSSGAAMTKDERVVTHKVFYSTQAQAEAAIQGVLSNPPPLKPFLDAEDWTTIEFPTAFGRMWLEKPALKADSLVTPDLKAASGLLTDELRG